MPARLVREPKKVTSRKKHTCRGCAKEINQGEKYFVTTCAMDDRVYDIKECVNCREYYKNECMNCSDLEFCVGEHYYIGELKDCQSEKE